MEKSIAIPRIRIGILVQKYDVFCEIWQIFDKNFDFNGKWIFSAKIFFQPGLGTKFAPNSIRIANRYVMIRKNISRARSRDNQYYF